MITTTTAIIIVIIADVHCTLGQWLEYWVTYDMHSLNISCLKVARREKGHSDYSTEAWSQ